MLNNDSNIADIEELCRITSTFEDRIPEWVDTDTPPRTSLRLKRPGLERRIAAFEITLEDAVLEDGFFPDWVGTLCMQL